MVLSERGLLVFSPPPPCLNQPYFTNLRKSCAFLPSHPGRLLSAPRVLFGPGPMNRKEKQNMFSLPPPPPIHPCSPQQPQEIVCFPSIPPLAICLQPPSLARWFLTSEHCFLHPMNPKIREHVLLAPPPLPQEWSCRFNRFHQS